MKIVPGTAELYQQFYGHPPAFRSRVYFVLDGEEMLAAFGFAHMGKNRKFIYLDMKPELKAREDYKKLVLRGSKFGVQLADENGWILVAEAAKDIETSEGYLKHFGFELNEQGLYERWPVQLRG